MKKRKQTRIRNEAPNTETEKNLVTVISGIVDNFETISQSSERKEHELHQFMEGNL